MSSRASISPKVKLNLRQKLFLRFFCYPPPESEILDTDNTIDLESDPLGLLKNRFGNHLSQSIKDKIVLDVGCGSGEQVVGVATEGARHVIGVEIRRIFEKAKNSAKHLVMSYNKAKSTIMPIRKHGEASIDKHLAKNI